MKLTFLVHDRANYRGGPIVNMRRLLPRLVARGHQICILGLAGKASPTLDWLTAQHGIPVQKLPAELRFTHHRVKWVLKSLRANRPDVFVPNCFTSGLFAASWARQSGIPTLGYFRSNDPFCWAMAEEFIYGRDEWALSGVASVSRGLMAELIRRSDHRSHVKFCFLPSGVPLPDLIADQNRTGLNVCYIGRFEEQQKRFRDTAKAILRNVTAGNCLHAGFFGEGRETGWLQAEIARRNLGDRATIHGSVPPEELQQALANYHVSVLLSEYEGTPGAVMDAMATGLVPITMRLADGTSELVTDGLTGLQCDDRENSFDDCLRRLAADTPLRLRLAENARRRVSEQYSIERTVVDFESFVQELVEQRGPQSELRIPRRIILPPVREELSREDRRPTRRRQLIHDSLKHMRYALARKIMRSDG